MKVITEIRNIKNSQFELCPLGQHKSKNTFVKALNFPEFIENTGFQKHLKSLTFQTNKRKVFKNNLNFMKSQLKMCQLGQCNSKNTFIQNLKFSNVIGNSDSKTDLKCENFQTYKEKVIKKNDIP